MNVHVLCVLEDETRQKKFRLSVCTWTFAVDTIISKELAGPNKIWWVSSMYDM